MFQNRWLILALLSLAELFGMSLWLATSAVSAQLESQWGLSTQQATSLNTVVQLGFVFGTALVAALNLADILPSRFYFASSAWCAAVANLAILAAPSYLAAVACRFLVGFFLAGVYPPAMKMAATWFRSQRGFAIGTIVAALTCGKASPYLIRAVGADSLAGVILISSCAACAAGVLVLSFYRDGPHAFPSRPFRLNLIWKVVQHRPTRLAIFGYLGHMWELYAMWIWIPRFLASSFALQDVSESRTSLAGFVAIATGAAGCLWGGWAADRMGRERLVAICLAASGISSIAIGMSYGGPPLLVTLLAAAWGFFVVADSAQFSTLVTEVSKPDRVGTALTLQTSLGFLLTTVTINGVGVLQEWVSWRWAFAVLSLGPIFGIWAVRQLARLRRDYEGGHALERPEDSPAPP